jgi:carbon storage regulator
MLVLTRKRFQEIIIRDDIKITIVEIRGDKVQIGIDAPRDVTVHRKEVYDRIIQPDATMKDGSPT